MFKKVLEAIQEEISGEAAKRSVEGIIRYHRIQASPGFREAANYCLETLRGFGVKAEVLTFPADGKTFYWADLMPLEWEASEATLKIIAPEDAKGKLADYFDIKLSLIQRSAPADVEAEVVLLEDGEEESEYEGLDVRGKIVLTKGDVERVYDLAVLRRGALGIIYDGMREVPPIRHRADMPDALQYTSFWWAGDEPRCFGFVLSPKEGERLRQVIKTQERDGKPPVKVQAKAASEFRDGTIEVVSALIPGETDDELSPQMRKPCLCAKRGDSSSEEEVLVIAHLCHPQWSANDNASGSAAAMEVARTLQSLIDEGKLGKPKRAIRLLLVPEMTGTYAYLATYENKIPRMVAGVNLDMVGQDQELCGSSLLLIRSPQATPAFTDDLLERLLEEVSPEAKGFGGVGGFPLFRRADTPFMGGSDHYILADPSVGVPCPMLNQWPDRFYHTSLDTLDKVDPRMLKRVGAVAAAYAYFIATAGEREASWLGHEMVARFKRRVLQLVQEGVTEAMSAEDPQKSAKAMDSMAKSIQHLIERQGEALASLRRLADIEVEGWQEESAAFARSELEWVWSASSPGLSLGLPEPPPKELDEWESKAAEMVPTRLYRGPIPLRPYLFKLSEEERDDLHRLRKEHKEGFFTLPDLALYWADGKRNLLEIADLIELETGMRDVELLVGYLQMLAKLELIELK